MNIIPKLYVQVQLYDMCVNEYVVMVINHNMLVLVGVQVHWECPDIIFTLDFLPVYFEYILIKYFLLLCNFSYRDRYRSTPCE